MTKEISMNNPNLETMRYLKKECEFFKGDKALFWSGQLSQTIESFMNCRPIDFSVWLDLLYRIKTEYDTEIFSRMK